jgi:N-acylneuraminate cytidylyltransferase
MWRLVDGRLDPLITCGLDEAYNQPRQRLPPVYWQTGHVDAVRTATIRERHSMTGARILPVLVDARLAIDIDGAAQLAQAEALLLAGQAEVVWPTLPARLGPRDVGLVVFDFDGVFTDNRVLIGEDGRESVVCSREDGLGVALLVARGIRAAVLSSEQNGVVAARCAKLGITCRQAVVDKGPELTRLASEIGVPLERVVYLGNDVNDLECLRRAGLGVAVADAHPAARAVAGRVLTRPGGRGAVRELVEWILAGREERGEGV